MERRETWVGNRVHAIQNVLTGDVFVTHSINVSYPHVGGSQ